MSSRDLSYSNFVPITPKTEGVLPQSLVGGLQQNLQRGTQLIEVNGMDSDDGGSAGKLNKWIYFVFLKPGGRFSPIFAKHKAI